MIYATSRDGTRIACHRRGAGPPLVLVPGIGAANPVVSWTAVIPALVKHFGVYGVDRRGRGESGDGDVYALEREFEDIAAAVDAIGEPVYLLGHSFGGLCALEAALLTNNIRKLIVYEGAPPPDALPIPEGIADRLQALLDAGDREGLLATHYAEVAGMAPHEIEQLRASLAWPVRLALAHTLPRELRALEQYRFDAQRFKDLQMPTLLLLGGDSPDSEKAGTTAVDAVLPHSRLAVMPGQQHIAMYTAPDLFVREILAFVTG